MGRRRSIITKKQADQLAKTHEGRVLSNVLIILCALPMFIIAGFVGEYFSEGVAIFVIIGIFFAAFGIFGLAKEVIQEKERQEKEEARLNQLREANIEQTDDMDGIGFEEFVALIFTDLGYSAQTTKKTGDFGVDIILEKDTEKIIVQTKRYAKKISVSAVQEITTARNYYHVHNAWVVTNNYFTSPAIKLAEANDVKLIDREQLAEFIIKAREKRNQIDIPA